MSLVTYKDLCIDVNDPRPASEWWARTLGLRLVGFDDDPDEFKLEGPTPQHTVWMNLVPERHEVKNRVHLDVWAPSLEPFEGLSRVSEPGRFPWTTFQDPEGNEFCVFVKDGAEHRLKAVEVDAADPQAQAEWWLEVIGGTHDTSEDEDDWHGVADIPGAPFEGFDFVRVPESKTTKNRVHWDVTLEPGASLADLESLGATVLREQDDEIRWTVMADPEGNEFCVFDLRE